MNPRLPTREIVLLGAGHTNAHVLRMWRMAPLADARLTCVSDFYVATYSGMLPGTLAGQYPPERMQIDLARLCAAAGVRLICTAVSGLDVARRQLLFDDRPPLEFDVLSIGIGSTPRTAGVDLDDTVLPIKPMQSFLARLDERLAAWAARAGDRPLQVSVVGAGAGGVEIALCLPKRIERVAAGRAYELTVIDAMPTLLPGLPAGTAQAVRQELAARGVKLLLGQAVQSVSDGHVHLADGTLVPADLVLWAAGAAPPPLFEKLALPQDDAGFLLRRSTLQTTADAPIFVVGDSGTDPQHPTPKAGVYAVRQGPILWGNIHRLVFDRPLLRYVPQRGFLSLLNTGDGRAILSYKGLTLRGGWCFRLKDRIDGRFMDLHQDYSFAPQPMQHEPDVHAAAAQHCLGSTVGRAIVAGAAARLPVGQPPAPVQISAQPPVQNVATMAAFLDDPYLLGRVAALSAAGSLWARGARPTAAWASATLPPGVARQQEQLLHEMLAGGARELQAMEASLAGIQAIEGLQTTIGFSLLADPGERAPRTIAGLQPGDCLLVTKPLGSGVLLAAHAQARCAAPWLAALLPSLTEGNRAAAEVADEFSLRAATCVAGYGLAGHLLEMLAGGGVAAEVHLAALPMLSGVETLIEAGIEHPAAPSNRAAEASIAVAPADRQRPCYAVLFDPQTSGGLLLGVPADRAEAFLERLAAMAGQTAAIIGCVVPQTVGAAALRIV